MNRREALKALALTSPVAAISAAVISDKTFDLATAMAEIEAIRDNC